jgi:hypothetical protein
MNIKLCTLLTFLALGGPLGTAPLPAAGTTKTIPQLSADAPAEVEVLDAFEPDALQVGVKLFTDRGYVLKEIPECLKGQAFVRGAMERMSFRCTKAGVVTLLTPDPAHPRAATLALALESRGYARLATPKTFQLFGQAEYDQVRIYQKQLAQGEEFRMGKWILLVGPQKCAQWIIPPPKPWAENDGELLYNGIRLPKEWPPRTEEPKSVEPMAVPYLEHPPKVLPIDVGRQLFVDDFLVEQTDLQRLFYAAKKFEGNPVLAPQTELELNKPQVAIASPKSGGVWWDAAQQIYRMWYEAGWLHTVCYATSRDGLRWDRPELDVYPGSNRILDPAIRPDSWSVFPDYDGADPAARWKMYLRPPGGDLPGLSMVSPDGIHWSKPVESGLTGDRSTMFYNPFRKKWVYSLRSGVRGRSRHYWEHADFLAGAKWDYFRYGPSATTPVFWTAADRLDPADPDIGDRPQLYNLDAVAYESIMLGIYQMHLGPDNGKCELTGLPKITELNLAYSRDGFHWHRPDRTPFIPAARRDVWDRGYVQSVGGLCLVRGDRLWFYYIGFQGDAAKSKKNWMANGMYDRGSTGVAFMRRDGFASLDAGPQAGSVLTRPVTFSGKQLFVNTDCPQGELRVEILDATGAVIAPFTKENCAPVHADKTKQPIQWQGADDLSALRGRAVKFRFHLTNGKLYAFWVSPDKSGASHGYIAAGGPEFSGRLDTAAIGAPAQATNANGPDQLVDKTGHAPFVAPTAAKKVYVLLFGGQSNALGWGYQKYLEDTGDPLRKPQADVEMFYEIPGTGCLPEDQLLPLQSGTSNPGVKPLPNHYPALTNAPISRFGPELSFARTVRDHLHAPESKVAVIKFAMGGSSLWNQTNWLPDGTTNAVADGRLYRIFQETARRGIAALQKKYPDHVVEVLGMGWVQGESDALDGKGAEYQQHLTDFIADVRATFGTNLVFALSKISPNQIAGAADAERSRQWELVRAAQDAVAAAVPKVVVTETTGRVYAVSQGLAEGQFHFTSPALLQIGRDLGVALVKASGLENVPVNTPRSGHKRKAP